MKSTSSFLLKIACLFLLLSNTAFSQGVYQMWGTSREGGDFRIGALYSTAPDGSSLQVRHSSTVITGGSAPKYSDLVEYNGKFYGTTTAGGAVYNSLYGTIFEWDPVTNAHTVKYSFIGTTDGRAPYGTLALYNGKFYGSTSAGGANGAGVIFEWNPATNVYTKKIDLSTAIGSLPYGGMKLYNNKLYGLTNRGGSSDQGTIYEYDPATNAYIKKVDIVAATLGAYPFGSLVFNGTTFYATTKNGVTGGGTIIEWDPATNVCTRKFQFALTANGTAPYGDLTFYNGRYFGLTASGGLNGAGVIYEWDPATNVYTKRFDFSGSGDSGPQGHFTVVGNKLYALSWYGGNNTAGFIFEWDPVANQINYKNSFNQNDGRSPYSSFTVSSDGKLYSTCSAGGAEDGGTIFEWSPTTNTITRKISFNANDGKNSKENLVQDGNKIYGMTKLGGTEGRGTLFEWDLTTGVYTVKQNFGGSTGISYPSGKLVKYGSNYYALSEGGGSGSGTVFQWNPVTNTLTQLATFNGTTNGRYPMGSLALYNNKFYGVTSQGGAADQGTLFEYDPANNTLTKKTEFASVGGTFPYGDLVLYNNKFYGLTTRGGNFDLGVIYEWDPAANFYIKKKDLNTSMGTKPYGNLTLVNNKFYGLASTGGSSNGGAIFQWDPATNTHIIFRSFTLNSAEGYTPYGTLTLNNGKLYGVTNQSYSGGGVLFEWDPQTGIYTIKSHLTTPNPSAPFYTELLKVPVGVSTGTPGSCLSLSSITINASNSNSWVPITDAQGSVIAEIKANGNVLGTVTPSLYIHTGTAREDGQKRLYLNRNISFQVQYQPASDVDLRLYIKKTELDALKNATNSDGIASGVTGINDLFILKNTGDACATTVNDPVTPQTSTSESWGEDYVLKTSVSNLGTFYFAGVAPLPAPAVQNISDKCATASSTNAKISNPPAGSTVTVTQDGNAVSYNPADSTFTYFVAGTTGAGKYTITIKFDNGLTTTQKDFTYKVTTNTVPTFSFGTSLTICAGASVPSLGQISNNGIIGSWSPSAVNNQSSGVYTFTPLAGICATPVTFNVTVNSNVTPAFSFGNALTICAGGTVPALPATSDNGIAGTWSPVIVDNQNSATYTFTPAAGQCATTGSFAATVNPSVTTSVTINTPATSVCQGASVTFTATPVNGGTPGWQWKINGNNAGTGSSLTTSALQNNDKVQVEISSSLACAQPATVLSNSITMQVNTVVQPALSISGTTTVKKGDASLISTSVVNAGTSPVYQWQDSTLTTSWTNIPNGTSATLNFTPAATGVKLRCLLTSNAPCATSTIATSQPLEFTVNIPTAVGNINASDAGLRLYPNPVINYFTIDTLSLSDHWETLQIRDIQMKTVMTKNIEGQISVTTHVFGLPRGIYIAVLRKKTGETAHLKFMKL